MATSASEWKKKTYVELALPSGNTCLARRSGVEMFLKSGKVPNSLMPLIQSAISGKSRQEEIAKLEVNEALVNDMMAMFDLVVVTVVVEPKVHSVPENPENRKDDLLYADEVDLEDKQFLFQWAVGGTSDLEQFRAGFAKHVESVQQGEEVWSPPELPFEA